MLWAVSRSLDSPLAQISHRTLQHYEQSAADFWEGTRGHDVSQNISALLEAIEGKPPLRILDFGCGPGRDLCAFQQLGHQPIGLDGSATFVRMAKSLSGADVWHQDFLSLHLPDQSFDGIFANASLFHVPRSELARVLGELHACLRPGGILFTSNPRGQNQEGWSGNRYGTYHDLEQWRRFVEGAGFREIRHYYRPDGLPRDQQSWLATVLRRPEP
jgi:SAM-dependent methyltransferase